jgi:hypothetical protein
MVEIPTSFAVSPGTGENVITYDARPGDDTYWLLWSTDPEMADALAPEQRMDIGATGIYTHTGLTNGTPYYYLLLAWRGGHMSGFADRVAATPALDPTPPRGTVLIAGNAMRAPAYDVTLTLYATDDAVEVLLANDADFSGANWQPLADTLPWRIVATPEQVAFVYARFRDAAGNVSEVAMDGILLPHETYLPMIVRDE